jgi:hypothetical protein
VSLALLDNKVLKWILGICGAILIGALGSGVWQSLLAPAMHAIERGMLDFVSLFWTNYKNQIYQQIAADNQPAIALELFYWVTIASMFLAGMFTSYARGYVSSLTSAGSAPPFGIGTLRLAVQVSSLFVTVLVIGQLISFDKLSYINSADAHYHYVMRVATPYLDTHEQAEIESEFAQIGSREDYIKLLSMLEGKCTAHGRSVTKFDPW